MAIRAHTMVTTYDPTTNTVLLSATVNVYNPGTVTPISATIFDRLGNTLSNPLTSDASTGLVDFYLNVAQEVDLVVSKGGFTTRTYSNVPVLDDSSLELTALLTTTGDMVYASTNNSPVRLPIGSAGAFLMTVGGVPAWSNTTSNGLTISGGDLAFGASSNPSIDFSAFSGNCQIVPASTQLIIRNNANSQSNFTFTNGGVLTCLQAGIVLAGAAPSTSAGQISFGNGTASPGGGASATLTTVGGSGPTTATQNGWLKISSSGGNAFIPLWT